MYTPGSMPEGDLHRYLTDELAKISAVLQTVSQGQVSKVYKEPAKPRVGMIRIADGTNWDPGYGPGAYYYDGQWKLLNELFSFTNLAVFTPTGATVNGVALPSWSNGGLWTPGNVRKIRVRGCAGGGAGGYYFSGNDASLASGCGGAGGYFEGIFSITMMQSFAITVGIGGAVNNNSYELGGQGGTTSFGSLCSAVGGKGGLGNDGGGAGGAGGEATGGQLNILGGYGTDGDTTYGNHTGLGGSCPFGFGGRSGAGFGFSGTGYGGGGGGCWGISGYGGKGARGVIVVEW